MSRAKKANELAEDFLWQGLNEQEIKEAKLRNLILDIPTANAKVYLVVRTSEGIKVDPLDAEISPIGEVDILEPIKHRHVSKKAVYWLYGGSIRIRIPEFLYMELPLKFENEKVELFRGAHYTFDTPEIIQLQFDQVFTI